MALSDKAKEFVKNGKSDMREVLMLIISLSVYLEEHNMLNEFTTWAKENDEELRQLVLEN